MRNCQFYCASQNKKCPKHSVPAQGPNTMLNHRFPMNDMTLGRMMELKQQLLDQQRQLNLMINHNTGLITHNNGAGFYNPGLSPGAGRADQLYMHEKMQHQQLLEHIKDKKLQEELLQTKSKLRLLLEMEQHSSQQQHVQHHAMNPGMQVSPGMMSHNPGMMQQPPPHNIQLIQKQLQQSASQPQMQQHPSQMQAPQQVPHSPHNMTSQPSQLMHQPLHHQQQVSQAPLLLPPSHQPEYHMGTRRPIHPQHMAYRVQQGQAMPRFPHPPSQPALFPQQMPQQMQMQQKEEQDRQRQLMLICQRKAALAARARMQAPTSQHMPRPAPPHIPSVPTSLASQIPIQMTPPQPDAASAHHTDHGVQYTPRPSADKMPDKPPPASKAKPIAANLPLPASILPRRQQGAPNSNMLAAGQHIQKDSTSSIVNVTIRDKESVLQQNPTQNPTQNATQNTAQNTNTCAKMKTGPGQQQIDVVTTESCTSSVSNNKAASPNTLQQKEKEKVPGGDGRPPQYELLLEALTRAIMNKIHEFKGDDKKLAHLDLLQSVESAILNGEFHELSQALVDEKCTQTCVVQTKVWSSSQTKAASPPAGKTPKNPAKATPKLKPVKRGKVGRPRKYPYRDVPSKQNPTGKLQQITVKLENPVKMETEEVKIEAMEFEDAGPDKKAKQDPWDQNKTTCSGAATIFLPVRTVAPILTTPVPTPIQTAVPAPVPTSLPSPVSVPDSWEKKNGGMSVIGNLEQVFLMLHKDSDDDSENIDVNSFLANL